MSAENTVASIALDGGSHHEFTFTDNAEAGALYGDIYVSSPEDSGYMSFFDISDPAAIELLQMLEAPLPCFVRETVAIAGSARAVAWRDGLLYVSSSNSFMKIFDVSTPGAPVAVETFLTPGYARDLAFSPDYRHMAASGDVIFVSGYSNDVYVMIVDGGGALATLTTYDQVMGNSAALTLAGDTFVAAAWESGFVVFRDDGITGVHMGPLTASRTVRYEWGDSAPPVQTTLYWLEETTRSGSSAWYGPATLAAAP